MTEGQIERRYSILENLLDDKRCNYTVTLDGDFISIRNNVTSEGIYTDSLQCAKRWIAKDVRL